MDPPNRLVVMRRAPVAPARPSSAAFAWAGDRRPLASLIQPVNGAGSEGERAPAARFAGKSLLGHPPHRPEGGASGQSNLVADLEAVPEVEALVALAGRIEVRRYAVPVTWL
jgi:hypothetical protein